MLNSPQKTAQKSFTNNPSVRRYSKPIIFKTRTSEELIFKNLAASFRLRPSLNITNFSLFPLNKGRKLSERNGKSRNRGERKADECFVASYTPVLKSHKKKLQGSVKNAIKPMFTQHKVERLSLEIEGRPCSRAKKYECVDSYTSDLNERS